MSQASEMWCDEHWDPYRDGERNGILASVLIAEAFTKKASEEHDVSGEEDLNRIKEEHAPVCCWLGDDVMDSILEEASQA